MLLKKLIMVMAFIIVFIASMCIGFAENATPEIKECTSVYDECKNILSLPDTQKITYVRDYSGSNFGKWQRYDENKKGEWISQIDLYIFNNRLRSVSYFETDPGGDTARYIDYFFRVNGTTAYIEEDYRILSGFDRRSVTTVFVTPKGVFAGKNTKSFDLITKKEISKQGKSDEKLPKICLKTRDLLKEYNVPFLKNETKKPKVFVQTGHQYRIEAIDISPDQKYVVTASADCNLKLWDMATGRDIKTFQGHTDIVFSVAFSPDGKYLVSGSQDKTIKIWDIQSGKEIKTFNDEGFIKWVRFSADGKSIYSYLSGKNIKIWDKETGAIIQTVNSNPDVIALSTDGKLLVKAFSYSISVSDIENEEIYKNLSVPRQAQKKDVYFTRKDVYFNSIAISADNKLILTSDEDESGFLRLWSVDSGKEIISFPAQPGNYRSVAISSNGKLGLSVDKNNSIKLWDLTTGTELKSITDKTSDQHALLFSPDGKYALIGSGALRLWDIDSGKEVKRFTHPIDKFRYAAFSSDHKKAFTISYDNTIKLWNLIAGKPVQTFAQKLDTVWDIAFSPDNKYALTGSGNDEDFTDNNMRLWDINKGKVIKTFSGHQDAVAVVAFSPDGKFAISGSNENSMKLWDIETGKEIRTYKGHKDSGHTSLYVPIACLAYSPDGSFVISGSDDTTLKLWDTRTNLTIRLFGNLYNPLDSAKGSALKTFTGHTRTVSCVSISSDGKYALSGSYDKTVRLWDIEKGKLLKTFLGHLETIYFVDFSPDNKLALTGSYDGTLKIWDLTSGKLVKNITGSPSRFISGSFSENGKYVVVAASDSTIRFYNLKTDQEEVRMISFLDDEWINITPEGYFNCSSKGLKYITVSDSITAYPMEGIYYDTFYRPDILSEKFRDVLLEGR